MRYLTYLLSTCYLLLLSTLFVYAESLVVSLQVGSTQVSFSGYTSPDAFITIKEGSSTIGTTSSSGSGDWSKTINVAVPGNHTYTIHSTDSNNLVSTTISYTLSVTGNTTTSISHIVIPPTTRISDTTLNGTSYPGSTITITSSTGDSFTTTANSNGSWSFDLTSLTTSGTQTIKATATVSSYLSIDTTGISYTHNPANTTSSSSSTSTTSPSPSPSPLPTASPSISPTPQPFFIALYDQNNDGKLNMSELFDTIKSWLIAHLPCDLNRDGACNLIDLSILLYYFER